MLTIKKKRVSKKNKISWRKHVNIADVEEFLEDQRLEERLGPPLETLTNDELFILDTMPTEELLSLKERKRLKLLKPPRSFSILQPHTNVPDPIVKRNRVRSKEERKNELVKKREAYNLANGIKTFRELQREKGRKTNEERRQSAPKRGEFNINIWSDDEKPKCENEWFPKDTVKHNLRGIGNVRKTITRSMKSKPNGLPSVEIPHPGMSYNPSYNDHQNLLRIVAEKEAKIIKEEEHLNRVTRNMFRKVTSTARDTNWLKEMSEGIIQQDAPQEDNSDGEFKSLNPPVKNKKKTLKQRRKQREQLKLDQLRKQTKVEKKKVTDIHQLKNLKKQIEKNDIKVNMLREKRKKMQEIKKKEPKRVGPMKYEESELDFNMGWDIAGNLRNIKKEGNLLADRYKSLQTRNIIEPSVRQQRKKAKVKRYTKPGHKDDWMKTVAK